MPEEIYEVEYVEDSEDDSYDDCEKSRKKRKKQNSYLLSGIVDKVGDDKGRGNKEEGGPGQYLFSEY